MTAKKWVIPPPEGEEEFYDTTPEKPKEKIFLLKNTGGEREWYKAETPEQVLEIRKEVECNLYDLEPGYDISEVPESEWDRIKIKDDDGDGGGEMITLREASDNIVGAYIIASSEWI